MMRITWRKMAGPAKFGDRWIGSLGDDDIYGVTRGIIRDDKDDFIRLAPEWVLIKWERDGTEEGEWIKIAEGKNAGEAKRQAEADFAQTILPDLMSALDRNLHRNQPKDDVANFVRKLLSGLEYNYWNHSRMCELLKLDEDTNGQLSEMLDRWEAEEPGWIVKAEKMRP